MLVRWFSRWGAAMMLLGASVLVGCGGKAEEAPAATPTAVAQRDVTVTDIVGRRVTVKAPVQRMLLSEGRVFYIVAPLDKENPIGRVAGWADDLRVNDFDTYEQYRKKFPDVTKVPVFGSVAGGAFSVEKALEVKPDLMVLTYDAYLGARNTGLIDKLSAAGIPSIVIDFRQYPLENTIPSMHLMGRVMGREEQAQGLADFYTEQTNLLYTRMEKVKGPKPVAFLYRAAGLLDCCGTFGSGNMGLFIERAGGVNLGSKFISGWSGTLNPEQVIASNPDLVIATGSNWKNSRPQGGYVTLGYQTSKEQAQRELNDLMQRNPGWSELSATKSGRAHAMWHQFYISPYHFVTMLEFAKWMYPAEFADVNPEAIYRDFHSKFLPIEYSGTFWTSVK